MSTVACPTGGDCPTDCDRTQSGCVQIWGPDSEHLEALRMNAPTLANAWVCSFFQGVRPTAALCGVCGQTRARHTDRDRRRS